MKRRVFPALFVALAMLLTLAAQAWSNPGALGTAAGFEDDDANLAPNASGINFDWNSFATTTWTGDPSTRTTSKEVSGWQFKGVEDYQATTADSGFAGGTKQDNECAKVITAKADNKADLKRIYLASKTVNSHVYLELAWVRIPQNTTSPSAHVAFEFNQGTTACGTDSDGLVHRTTTGGGDMLVLYDFEGGSDKPTIRLSRWIASGSCEISSHTAPCWGPAAALDPTKAEAAVNTGVSPDPGTLTNGDAIAPDAPETLGVKEFGEAGIDLTNAGVFGSNGCTSFGKAFGVSRTSGNSGTAQMKDLVGPTNFNLSNCGRIVVNKTDGTDLLAGATFSVTPGQTLNGSTATSSAMSEVADGVFCVDHLLLNVEYAVTEVTPPPNFSLPNDVDQTFTPTTTGTCTGVDDTTTANLTFVDAALPGSLNITKVDDSGALIGGITFQLYTDAAATLPVAGKSCTTEPDSNDPDYGTCTISNIDPDTYYVNETNLPAGYNADPNLPAQVVIPINDTLFVTYTNTRTFNLIALVCQESNNTLYPSGVTVDTVDKGDSESSSQLDALLDAWATDQSVTITADNKAALEVALCGITHGSAGGLLSADDGSNPHTASVDIPNSQP